MTSQLSRASIRSHHPRAFEIETEAHLAQAKPTHRAAQTCLVDRIEHQESSPAGADQLAACGTVLHRLVVPNIDTRVRDARAALSLVLPMHVHQPAEFDQVAGLQRVLAAIAELLDEMQIADHLGVALLALVVLLLQDFPGRARIAGKEQQQVVFEVIQGLLRNAQGVGLDGLVAPEFEAADVAIGRDVLILLADWLLEDVELDVAGLLGQLLGMDQVLSQAVQRLENRRGEAARRAKSRSSRNIRHAGDFEVLGQIADQAQTFAHDGMANLVDRRCLFQSRVLDQITVDETPVKIDVDVLVDGSGDEKTAVRVVVRRQVRTAAAQRYTQWTAADDHNLRLSVRLSSQWPMSNRLLGHAHSETESISNRKLRTRRAIRARSARDNKLRLASSEKNASPTRSRKPRNDDFGSQCASGNCVWNSTGNQRFGVVKNTALRATRAHSRTKTSWRSNAPTCSSTADE